MDGWEDRAEQWIAWADPAHDDAYWYYRDAFFALVPPPTGTCLEIGCGEGRATRDLRDRGHAVLATDASPTLIAAASERDPGGRYEIADASSLPYPDAHFDLAVAYNVLMDVADVAAVVREVARVLGPGGALVACITHPFTEEAPRGYLRSTWVDIEDERAGRRMRFSGFHHPLETYARAHEAAGLVFEALREPSAPPGSRMAVQFAETPLFLMWRARKPGEVQSDHGR